MIKNGTKYLLLCTIIFAVILVGFFLARLCLKPEVPSGGQIPADALTVDLNRASANDLLEIPGIDENLAARIIAYRDRYGDYVLVSELLDIYGMTDELYEQISHYICIGGS